MMTRGKKQKGHLVVVDDPSSNIAIKVDKVSKSFVLPHNKQNSIKGGLINVFNGDRSYEVQEVLKDVSFEIKKGEFFGIVGRNGSGKSTLLKMLAGIYTPTKGSIIVNGSLTPFIELGVGFNPELTGRENVFLNGALLGFNRTEMADMYDEIVEFAELERFMDQKLKNYSSGMQVRLAFSIAIRAQSDILILDEVLAVGDAAFQRKCTDYFTTLRKAGKTVALVTHDMSAVQKFCTKAIVIEKGTVIYAGSPEKAAELYSTNSLEKQNNHSQINEEINGAELVFSSVNDAGDVKKFFKMDKNINIKVSIKALHVDLESLRIGLVISNDVGQTIVATNTINESFKVSDMKMGESADYIFRMKNTLNEGLYRVSGAVTNNDNERIYARRMNQCEFIISRDRPSMGVFCPDIEVRKI